MKKVFLSLLLTLTLFADAFVPLHSNLVGELLTSDFVKGGSLSVRKRWDAYQWSYLPYWNRLKFYVPGGTIVSVQMMAGNNIPIRFHLKFKEGPVDHINATYVKALMYDPEALSNTLIRDRLTADFATYGASAGTAAFNVQSYTSEGGWVYLYLAEDTSLKATVYTSVTSFEANLVYTVIDKQKFTEWLYSTPLLTEYGNPSAAVSSLEEINDIKGEIVRTTVDLDIGNVYYTGPDPFSASIDIDYTNATTCGDGQTYVNGECIDSEINSNVTGTITITNPTTTTVTTPIVTDTTVNRTCPEGTTMNDEGVCVASTVVNTTTTSTTTVTSTTQTAEHVCPTGTTMNAEGVCVVVETEVTAENTDHVCPDGTIMNAEGVCVVNESEIVAQSNQTDAQEVAKVLATKKLNINGYFAYYGTEEYDPYAWVYVSADGSIVAKLDGMDTQGNLKWTDLINLQNNIQYISEVKIENGQIVFGETVSSDVLLRNEYVRGVVTRLATKKLNINGYFAYYGTEEYDPYAWVYVSADGSIVAKLDGMDTQGNLKWTDLINLQNNIQYISEVKIENGQIVFGETVSSDVSEAIEKLKQMCLSIEGAYWDEETKSCKAVNE